MRTLAIGLFVLCAATAYADDIDDLEQRIDDLESEIDDLRSPRPALPALPPGWKWRFVTYAEDPVNWGWQKVPPPIDLKIESCNQKYQKQSLDWLDCIANET